LGVGVGVLGFELGRLDPGTLIGLWLVEGLALEQCARQRLEPRALACEELGHLVLGVVDDSADLVVDQLLGRRRGR
jgi:hypothetical protein